MGDIYGKSVYDELVKNSELYKGLLEENKNLKEENAELKSDLSKFRDSFKKYRDYEKEELAESCYDLARENEKLKEDFDNYKKKVSEDMKGIVKEQTENIKLFDTIKGEYKKLEKENRELKKENELLKECNIRNYTSRSNTDDMNLKLLEENKRLKEKLSEVTMIADDEKQSIEHILELEEENRNLTKCNLNLQEHIDKVEEGNKRLKEVYEACNIDSINKAFKAANLEMENKKLKEELERYKKQYEHSMGED